MENEAFAQKGDSGEIENRFGYRGGTELKSIDETIEQLLRQRYSKGEEREGKPNGFCSITAENCEKTGDPREKEAYRKEGKTRRAVRAEAHRGKSADESCSQGKRDGRGEIDSRGARN